MTELEKQAQKLVFKLDEMLEPYEETSHPTPESNVRLKRIRKILERASIRYYRRRGFTKPNPYSLIEMIRNKAKENEPEPEPKKVPVKWGLPKVNPKIKTKMNPDIPPMFWC